MPVGVFVSILANGVSVLLWATIKAMYEEQDAIVWEGTYA